MKWQINDDIAKLNTDKINLIIKVKAVIKNDGTINLNAEEEIFLNHDMKNNEFALYMAKAMRELSEQVDLNKLQLYKECKMCKTIFPIKNKKSLWCSESCKQQNKYIKKDITDGKYSLDENIDFITDTFTFRDTSCNVLLVNIFDAENEEDEQELELYEKLKEENRIFFEDIDEEGEAIVFFDKEGELDKQKLILAFEYVNKTL